MQNTIDNDIKAAMLAGDNTRRDVLRMVKSTLANLAIEKKRTLENSEVIAAIQKGIKTRLDSVEAFEKGGRPELADAERREIDILTSYLPAGLSPEELDVLVKAAITETGATTKKQMGAVMKLVTARAEGRADGRTISAAVGAALQ